MSIKNERRGRREKFYVFYDENDFVKYCGTAKQLADDGVFKKPDYHIENSPDGFIHTSNGTHIQVRSKDARDASGSYHPIYSRVYGRYVSNKNHAFYFQKQFVYDIRRMDRQW